MGLIPYSIWSPPYSHNSGGLRALRVLGDELRARGCDATVGHDYQPGAIAVYPEIVDDNPLGADRIVRWLLQAKPVPADGLTYAWASGMGDWPVLTVDIIEPDLFYPRPGPRHGIGVWIHKGIADLNLVPDGAHRISHGWPATRGELADLLGSLDHLRSFDAFSAMNAEATLCGTPVVILDRSADAVRLTQTAGWPSAGIAWSLDDLDQARHTVAHAHDHYTQLRAQFAASIDQFIADTQRHFA